MLIADDEALVTGRIQDARRLCRRSARRGRGRDGVQAVRQARAFGPDVVLMDIRMPIMHGLEAAKVILDGDQVPAPSILIVTTFDEDEHVFDALRSGASGFVLKDTPPEQLLDAIRVVASGDALLTPSITRRLIAEFARRPQAVPPAGRSTCAAHRARARGIRHRSLRPIKRGDRGEPAPQRRHRQDSRQPTTEQTARARPRPACRDRLRDRRRFSPRSGGDGPAPR